jgi:YVTN family beta-propeller protein
MRLKTSSSKFSRILAAAALLLVCILEMSCGENYRPVAIPVLGPQPDPAAAHFVISLHTNGDNFQVSGMCTPSGTPPPCIADPGTASRIDVSGDSNVGVLTTGILPTHAALLPNGSKLFVASSDDTVTASNTSSPTTVAATIALTPGSHPVFVHTTENANVYVANSGNDTVSVINANSNVVTTTIALPGGSKPIALAETPNGQKLYVVNQGSPNAAVINTQFASNGQSTLVPIGAAQVWAAARSDSARVYILDTTGKISTVDTTSDAVINFASAAAGANFMAYDKTFNRLFVTNPNAATVTMFDVSSDPPVAHAPIAITPASTSPCTTAAVPTSVTVLGDGSRAYVASYQLDAGAVCTQVSVIDTGTGSVTTTIPLSQSTDASPQTGCGLARFRVFTTSSGGGTNTRFKVFVSQCDAGSTAVIYAFQSGSNPADTFNNIAVPAPLSSFPLNQVSISAASQAAATATTPATTTYSYTVASGSMLTLGANVSITGMSDAGNDGSFVVSGTSAGMFSVVNASGVTASGQSGTGISVLPQNPIFLVAGP